MCLLYIVIFVPDNSEIKIYFHKLQTKLSTARQLILFVIMY